MHISMLAALSHAPGWDMTFDHKGPGERFVAAVGDARRQVAAAKPDFMVVFGPDHARNFFFDLMPPFCIGVEAVVGFGDFGSLKGPLPADPELGRFIADHVRADGYDPAISYNMGIDHGVTQAYQALADQQPICLTPIMINCLGSGMPSLRRCYQFGQAVGRALREFPGDRRVVIVGSGGLSHSPPSQSPDHPGITAQQRDYVINGRPQAQANSDARDARAIKMRSGEITGPVNETWDAWFLASIQSGNIESILQLTDDDVLHEAGTGGQEVRCWVAALGAWGGAVETSTYEPVPGWITGMGCISGSVPA